MSTFDVHDPATGDRLATIADGGTRDAVEAVDAAARAAASWAAAPTRARSEVLHRCFTAMLADRDELAALISAENGKSLADAAAEVTYAAEFFRWFAEECVREPGTYDRAPAGGVRSVVVPRPVGIAALVTPWNFPAAMATRKIAPALAAGCTVVLKPASETPLTALAIDRLLTAAGVPEGVVNVVPTTRPDDVVGAWLSDGRVRKISFTGSTRVGRLLLRQAAERVVNASMELGGNAPFVVLPDADLDAAVAGAMVAKFRGGGQACTAANRFYVHASVHEEFVDRFGAQVRALTVGPAADGNQIGPMINTGAVERIERLVRDTVAAGATVSHSAEPTTTRGTFVAASVLRDVPADAAILREEIFGPVAPIVSWSDEADLVRRVNDSEAGLAAYVFGGGLSAWRFAERIEAGMVGVNRGLVSDPAAPFGGVKQSGLGREGGDVGMREFQELQYLSVDWPAP